MGLTWSNSRTQARPCETLGIFNSETEDLRNYEGFFVLEIGILVQICALCRQLEHTFDERVIAITSAKFHWILNALFHEYQRQKHVHNINTGHKIFDWCMTKFLEQKITKFILNKIESPVFRLLIHSLIKLTKLTKQNRKFLATLMFSSKFS